ncbi:amino acid ABC transporter permease [Nocardiopsis metallicus]|uniref:Polar amino acid transport system permease protein n=1 Tax=Nocardiopsis metallicus TaxID=179819 RepID=A0A840WPI4_9ACTN|nr:amino acid ABC transporter permease [Nocardiopsis metallicus]MBB5494921.1 polar amino acid transport system permease protein [Nocardiopsis metallicus]
MPTPAAPPTPRAAAPPRPEELTAVPVRHYGRWLGAIVVSLAAGSLLWSLLTNPNLDIRLVLSYLTRDFVLRGLGITIVLTVVAMVIGVLGGVLLAVMRMSPNPVLRTVAWFYLWFFRGTPLLVQIIFWGFLGALYPRLFMEIPFTGIVLFDEPTSQVVTPFVAAVLGLALNEVAYAAEIIRGGMLSVDRGQTEAAQALGMRRIKILRRIVLPQAMRVIVPPMGNDTINMLKMTALVSVIGGSDLLTAVQNVYAQNFQVIPLLAVAVFWYLALTSLLSVGQHYLEKRFGRGFGETAAPRNGALSRLISTKERL